MCTCACACFCARGCTLVLMCVHVRVHVRIRVRVVSVSVSACAFACDVCVCVCVYVCLGVFGCVCVCAFERSIATESSLSPLSTRAVILALYLSRSHAHSCIHPLTLTHPSLPLARACAYIHTSYTPTHTHAGRLCWQAARP